MASRSFVFPVVPVVIKALVGVALVASGFVAVSDDDFARVVIAQSFAETPTLDPSGTSWLPFPFWLYGTVFVALEPSLAVARAIAWCLGVAAVLGVYVAARWLGASPKAASIGASIAAVLPHSAWLGVATVPELPTAALILLGMAGAASREPHRILGGALALLAATLSRYEAWPVAACFSLLVAADGLRSRSVARLSVACAASAGMLAWVLHGAVSHDDALFFLHRVSSYREALGPGRGSAALAAARPLFALLVAEPELTSTFAASFITLRAAVEPGTPLGPGWQRAAVLAATLTVFLCVGGLLGGEATHHPSRPLLSVWLLLAVACGVGLARWQRGSWRALRSRGGTGFVAACLTLIVVSRLHYPRDSFAPRTDERRIGAAAHAAAAADGERVMIDTTDYGYFAIVAAFGAPSRAVVLRSHDPRDRSAAAQDVAAAARQAGAQLVVVDRRGSAGADALPEVAAAGPYALLRVD